MFRKPLFLFFLPTLIIFPASGASAASDPIPEAGYSNV